MIITPADLRDNREALRLELPPGFFTESSDRGAKRWKEGDKVRFKNGLPEKLGGWTAQTLTGASHSGLARRMHEWTSLDAEKWIAYGTHTKLFLVNRNVRYDITPVRRTVVRTNPFTTVNTSTTVTVTDAGHGAQVGDAVRFTGASAVGGLTISGEYTIVSILGDTYTITAASPASSSATGGGTVTMQYDISIGAPSRTLALGWGVGPYGDSTFGTARSIGVSGIVRDLRVWSLDNFGEDLIASPRGGAVYHWDRTGGPEARAVLLPDAPATNERVLVSNSGAQIICLGAFDPVANSPDPMFVRVGDIESLTVFTINEANSVFEERLATGSRIITGVRTAGGVLIGTDEADYIMQDDPDLVFRIRKLAEGKAPIGPNAMIERDGVCYWMADHQFMRFDGVVDEIPCEVWQRVFAETIDSTANPDRIDREQVDKVYCVSNEKYSELWWFYPSAAGDGECDRYVVFNTEQPCWYFGTIERTAALPQGPSYDLPTAIDPDGTFWLHETGVNDGTDAMTCYIESYDTQLGEGQQEMQVSRAVPDFVRFAGTVLLTLKAREWPRSNYVTKGPYTITTSTTRQGVRCKGRQMAVRITSSALNDDWRMGAWTFYIAPDAEGG